MDKDITKILRGLRSIEPDKNYAHKSKMIILSLEKPEKAKFGVTFPEFSLKNVFETLRFSSVFIVAFFLIFSILGGVSYINKTFSPLALEGLDQKSLVIEAKDINNSIQITLEEIKYLDQANKKAINTISELSKNKPIYSNIATSSIASDSTSTEDIDNFLITSPTSTDESNIDIDALLDKISQ